MSSAVEPHEPSGTKLDRQTRRAIAVVVLSLAPVGLSYGAIAQSAGIPAWLTVAMAMFVLAGASEMLFVGMIGLGAAPLVAAAAGLAVNIRNIVYGVYAGSFLKRDATRVIAAHFAIDEPAALAVPQPTVERKRTVYWVTGIGVLVTWVIFAWAGTLLAEAVGDPSQLGLDAALPALFFALVASELRRDRGTRIAAITGAVIALILTPFLPVGLGPILGLGGLIAGGFVDRLTARPGGSKGDTDG